SCPASARRATGRLARAGGLHRCVQYGIAGADGDGRQPLGAVTSTYIVLVTAAFVSFVLLRPEEPPLNRALRSIGLGGIATAALIQIVWGHVFHGGEAWSLLGWEATRQASLAIRYVVELSPPQWVSSAFAMQEPAVRFASVT